MKLYGYWRSTTSYRVRIALGIKGLSWQSVPVNLLKGEQTSSAYAQINPSLGVPALVCDDGEVITQSMAILEWLEEGWPDPPILPQAALARARVRAAALAIATDIHPVNNMRVIDELKQSGFTQEKTVDWMRLWMRRGLASFDALIRQDCDFCFGDRPGLADICLVPQLYNAHRFNLDLADFPRLRDIEQRCLELPAFRDAAPEQQIDAA